MKKHLYSIAKFTTKHNIKKLSYWTNITWPISTIIIWLMFNIPNNYKKIYFNKNSLSSTLELITLMFAISFSSIISYEFNNDNSNKINEFIWSISDPVSQFNGKILGIINLIIVTIFIYIIETMIFMQLIPQINFYIIYYLYHIGIRNGIIMILLLMLSIGWIIILSANLGILIKNKSHILQVSILIYIYVTLCITVNYFINIKSAIFINLLNFIFPIYSQINDCKYISNQGINITIILSIIIQISLLYLYYKYILNMYKYSSIVN